MTDWYVKGAAFANCNCSYGCPCQFNASPSQGDCRAFFAARIDEGRHGGVRLDGLAVAGFYSWPGAVHEGNGTMQLVIDERADERQRAALLRILTGQDTRDMATMWWIYHAMSPNRLPTLYEPIDLAIDVDGRRARINIPGLVESSAEPIRNPVTGAEHRVRIDMPDGFEYELAEIGSGSTRSTGAIALDLSKSYGQFCRLHLDQNGVVHRRAREEALATA